jgi:molecular chaperone DnaJ
MSLFLSNGLSSANSESTSESSKNEGFLKSVWHKLTDNPAHSKDGTKDGPSSTETPSKEGTGDEKTKDEKDAKKASGTGI